MSKIYTPGVRPVRYTGEHPYVVRELKYARFESVITLEKGDIVFLPLLVAVTLLKRKQRIFEAAEHLVLEGTVCEPEVTEDEEVLDDVQTDTNLSDPIDLNDIDTTGLLDDAGDADETGETQTVERDEQASSEDAEDAGNAGEGEEEVAAEAGTETLEEAAAQTEEHSDEENADGVEDTQGEETVITKENIMDESVVSMEMIKAACKAHNITIGKKKRGDLVALLLPYLDN